MNTAERPKLLAPNGTRKILLHSCCPCEGEVLETLLFQIFNLPYFFIILIFIPKENMRFEKEEDKRFCDKLGIHHVDVDYDPVNWFNRVKGLEWEPERGARCTQCFDMRFERAALYASENNFSVFSSSLGISRWKNMKQINGCGERAASRYHNLTYWTYNWRKAGGSQRMIEISKRKTFTSRNIVDAYFLFVILTNGATRKEEEN